MPAYTTVSTLNSAIPTVGSRGIQKNLPVEPLINKVHRYTVELARGNNREMIDYAFLRLSQLDCPIICFEKCQTEAVLAKFYADKVEYLYQVNKLNQKFAKLRRQEMQKETKGLKIEMEEEEYNPEYPAIRGSIEMEKRKLPTESALLAKYAVYVPTPLASTLATV